MNKFINFIREKINWFIKKVVLNKYIVFTIVTLILLQYCYVPFVGTIINKNMRYLCYFLFIVYILNFKFSVFSLLLFIYYIIAAISSINNPSTNIYSTFLYFPLITMALYIELGLRNNCKQFLTALSLSLSLLTIINFITILVYPFGMYFNGMYWTNWFFQYDNLHMFLFIPTLLLAYICTYYHGNFYKLIFLIVLCAITFSVFYCYSANSVFSYVLILLFLIFNTICSKMKIFNCCTYLTVPLILFFMIVIFRMQYLFKWLITGIFHKSLTLNNRTQLWDMVIEGILDKPLLGHGILSGESFSGNFGVINYTHAHNTILDVLYKGGLALLVSFFSLIVVVYKKLQECKNHFISKLVSFMLFCMLIIMTFEAREEHIGLYIIFAIGYNIRYIIDSVNNCQPTNRNEG